MPHPRALRLRRLILTLCLAAATPAFAEPPPGHPSADLAVRLLGVPAGNPASVPKYHGTVVRAIDSNAFTYIEVAEQGATGTTSRWIAAPRVGVSPGTRIGYDEGRLMTGFYSRKLGITFESISFVDRVALLAPDASLPPAERK